MPTWPRTQLPQRVTDLSYPGPIRARSHGGRWTIRSTTNVGAWWTETYMLSHDDEDAREILALARAYWRDGTIFDVVHRLHMTPKGTATGTILVDGASQTGSNLAVDGCTGSNPWLKAGDVLRCTALNYSMVATADVNQSGGDATIPISPPIFSGNSPGNDTSVEVVNPTIRAMIGAPPDMGDVEPSPSHWGIVKIVFQEAP